MEDKQKICHISETPVTRLSRILSQASFVDSKGTSSGSSLIVRSVTSWLPADIDESANQEAPTTTNSDWILGFPFSDTQETSYSFSSGYYSSSLTRSAPQLHSGSICSNSSITAVESSVRRSRRIERNIVPHSASAIERTCSLGSQNWLTKRQNARRWPRISGISRKFSYNIMDSSFEETNSCPAAIFSTCTKATDTPEVKVSLTTHKISTKRPKGSTPLLISCSSTCEKLSKCEKTEKNVSPLAKRRRTQSSSSPDKPLVSAAITNSLDDTVPIQVEKAESVPSDSEDRPLDFVRLHSTPAVSIRPPGAKSFTPHAHPKRHSFFGANQNESKLGLSRCISVPIHSVERALSVSRVDNHRSSMCDDSWASVLRQRALPVVDRTASGLHCVTPDIVAELVRNSRRRRRSNYRNIKHVIVDCRFPYEYEGGHIQDAINIFTHSDLVQEIFNRVPAQRPPGATGPPKLLGDGLARRLAATVKEPLSAPCELASPNDEDESNDDFEEDESWMISEEDQTGTTDHIEQGSSSCSSSGNAEAEPLAVSEIDHSSGSSHKSCSSGSSNSTVDLTIPTGHDHPAFVVIFHCEFSSQRAPDLAAFLRNVDRLSNYDRYPFLYFPEIYIMQGGYSAFYRKYPRLCCPKQYVKMFHRDYRDHLRLYRRLTKRVSSACLACIRPQNRLLVTSGNPPPEAGGEAHEAVVPPIFGLDFSADTTLGLRPPLLPSPCSFGTKSANATGPLSRSRSQATELQPTSMLDYESDKENMVIGPSDNTFELAGNLSANALDNTTSHEANGKIQTFLQSPAGQMLSAVSPFHDKTACSDSPLSVAEAVVRAGHRVMAATLTSAVPSAEVVEALDIFNRRAALPIQFGLKRSRTVAGMFRESNENVGGRKRPANSPARNLLPLSSLDNLATPVTGRLKRANTLGCRLSLEMIQKETSDVLTAGTPILNINCQTRNPVDSPTVDFDVGGGDSS